MTEPIRLGVIGLSTKGWASTHLAPPLLEEPLASSLQLRAVSTSNDDSANASASKYSTDAIKVKAYSSTDDIAADPELDMIAVSVNIRHHLELSKKVIASGKTLFVEWPAGVGLKETKLLAGLVAEKGIRNIVGLQARQGLLFRKVKAIIESGEIGDVLSTSMTMRSNGQVWSPSITPGLEYLLVKDKGATMLDIPGGHFLDPFTHILGPVATLSATTATQLQTARLYDVDGNDSGRTVPVTAPTQFAITGTLKSGAVFSLHLRAGMGTPADVKAALPFQWIIDGTKGNIRIENDHPGSYLVEMFPPRFLFVNDEQIHIEDDGKTNEGRAWEEFLKGKGAGDYTDLEDALKMKVIIDAIWRSAEEGVRVQL